MNRTSHAQHQNMHMETAVNQIDVDTDVDGEKTVMRTETIDAESKLEVFWISRSETLYEAAPKLTPCISIPQPKEEQSEHTIQIKHEPELILEPEELPDCAITDEEAITNDNEPSVALWNTREFNKCYICKKFFETFQDVQFHLLEHRNMIPYQCSVCTMETEQEFKITSLNLLHRHFRMHVNEIKCPMCSHRTCTKESMKTHMEIHHQQRDQVEYICKQCGKKYVNKDAMRQHVHTHKAVDERRFPCSYCDKRLLYKSDLILHERIHTGEKPYQCYACGKSFSVKGYLTKHISGVHMKSEQVNDGLIRICKFEGCDFSTTKKDIFKRHIFKRKHELKFQCSQCSKRFPIGRELRQHQQVHTGEKLFQCEQCDKSYKWEGSLRKHVYGSTGKRS